MLDVQIIKKDGTLERFKEEKINIACDKAAARTIKFKLTDEDHAKICNEVIRIIQEQQLEKIPVYDVHNIVESILSELYPEVGKSYREYRNYKKDFIHMMDDVYVASQSIRYIGDKDNANTDSALVATKRSLIFNELNKALYKKFFMTVEELQACKDGFIYVHDMSARLDTMNCFDRSTRFITNNGIKSFWDYSDGDECMVISHKGIWRKAVVHSYGWQKLQRVTFARAAGEEKTVLVTPNHRWILKDGTETTDLKVGDKLIYTPDITKFDWDSISKEDKKLWCLGFGIGDGSIVRDNDIRMMHIRLCGKKGRYASRFEDCGYTVTQPKSLEGDYRVRMPDVHSKEVPALLLNHENIKYFVNGLMCADGNRNIENRSSEFRGIQVTGVLNEHIADYLSMAGYYVTSERRLTGEETNYAVRHRLTKSYQCYSNCGNKTWFVKSIEPYKLNPKSQVWCLEVEEDHSFLLEHGIPTGNCCLFDVENVLKGGFEMGNIFYTEPKSLDVAFDVIGDIILATAAQQYGGFTVPEIDKILVPYAHKSFKMYCDLCLALYHAFTKLPWIKIDEKEYSEQMLIDLVEAWAIERITRDFEQGFQGIEYKLNTVGSSRGDYPFITMTFGLSEDKFGILCNKTFLRIHREGQGKPGYKKPVLFPKLVFLYDENLHGVGKPLEEVFEAGILCTSTTMYPDWLSLSGKGFVCEMYQKYGKVISPMGCRAFLSPWYERGGMTPADENDVPVFVGRFNIGAVSLNLPMILQKSRQESRDFYEVLDEYLEMIRGIHIRTYDYLGEMKASTNPVAYCEGGFYGGHLKPTDKIKPILKAMTASFGITALNEMQYLYNGKTIVEDGAFALEVMEYINKKVDEFKYADGNLYAIYGTPAESLCLEGDTPVETIDGYKKIKDIKVDDLVRSYNELSGRPEFKRVTKSWMTNEHAMMIDIEIVTSEGHEIIQATIDHPFAVVSEDNGKVIYKEARTLEYGDKLITNEHGNTANVYRCTSSGTFGKTYNLEVEDNHNYFVGRPSILVHNCGLQIKQFRKLYGIKEGVSDRPYVSNSFHCGVWEDITPIQKQDLEGRFWDLCKGGRIQYVRYPNSYNIAAIRTLVRRAMEMGFYEGANLSLAYCDDCGHQELEMDSCPKCGSRNLTKIDRMNGYLSYSRVHGDTRLNAAKMAEIADRKSM